MSNNRTCKVCGTKYNYCPTCGADAFKPAWLSMFCSRNCYDTFMILSNLTNKKIAEEMAKKEIIKFDTNKVTNDTMIKRINELYRHSSSKPLFDVTQGSISVTLPLLNNIEFTANEEKVFYGMKSNISYTRTEVETISSLNKDTVIRTLNSLIEKGVIMKKGSGKATVYQKR